MSQPHLSPAGLETLRRRIVDGEDLSSDEAAMLLAGDAGQRQLAHAGLFKTAFRDAVDHLGALAAAQGYRDQNTINVLAQLAPMAQNELPLLEAMRQVAFQAAAAGNVEDALRNLQHMWVQAEIVGQRRNRRSRKAMRLVSEPHAVDAVITSLARHIPPVAARPAGAEPLRCAIVTGTLMDENSITNVAVGTARGLRDVGVDVRIISTESALTGQSKTLARVLSAGFPVLLTGEPAYAGKIASILRSLEQQPVHVALYIVSAIDVVAKILSCSTLAPAQVMVKVSYTHQCGRFNYVLTSIDPREIDQLPDPSIGRFNNSPVVLGDAIDAAAPIDRAAIGVSPEAVILGTFGRLQKCVSPGFTAATGAILAQEPRAVLVLAGPDAGGGDRQKLQEVFGAAGVLDRVRFLGPRYDDVPALLKATDVYLDTFPWPGGQSLLEAMYAGLPVVAMRAVNDPELDASGSVTSAAERFMPADAELAGAGDVDGYVRIARSLIADERCRRAHGERLFAYAHEHYAMRDWVGRLHGFLRAAVDESAQRARLSAVG